MSMMVSPNTDEESFKCVTILCVFFNLTFACQG